MNVLQRFISEYGERRKVVEIPPDELDSLLYNFLFNAKEKNNTEYEPATMFSFSRSIQRYLGDNNAKINILKDEEFKVLRAVKCRELRKQGKGNKFNVTDISLKKDEASGEEYLKWTTEKESKTRHGNENEHQRSFCPKAYKTGDRKCPVSCFKKFVYRRPEEAKSPKSPFVTDKNQKIKFGSLTTQWERTRLASSVPVLRKIY